MIDVILDFIEKGGIMMFPLILCSILALAVAIERGIVLRRPKIINSEIISVIENIKGPEDVHLAVNICKSNKGSFANIVTSALQMFGAGRDDVKEAIEDQGRQEIRFLERGLVILETIASISPLIGLLGTVIGMIKVFAVINEKGLGEVASLSGGISEALITTVVGLFVAIPSVIFYNYFSNKVENIVLDIEKYTSSLISKLHPQ